MHTNVNQASSPLISETASLLKTLALFASQLILKFPLIKLYIYTPVLVVLIQNINLEKKLDVDETH